MKKSRIHFEAMEARSVDAIPAGKDWQYEPKWDGFRCLLTRDADAVAMYSKSGQDLGRYFPEVVAAALTLREKSFVLDGEIVVPVEGQFSFDDLLQRIHPAASRVKKLAEETPALFLAFDLLKKGKTELAAEPLDKAAPATRRLRRSLLFRRKSLSSFSRQPEAEGRRTLASVGRRRKRRRHRETPRPAISGRQPRRHAKDKAVPKCGLRHRRLPLRGKPSSGSQGCRIASSRTL